MTTAYWLLAGAAAVLDAPPPDDNRPEGSEPPAQQAQVTAGNRAIYAAAFYGPFRPQTALDMLARTPGFSLDAGGEARGFGANAGNVLIDGARPTIKSGGLELVLGRIAASRVDRIELIQGLGGADAMGRAVIANIVLRATSGGSGNVSLELLHAPGEPITPGIDINYARSIGRWQASAGVLAWIENNPDRGSYRLIDTAGTELSVLDERLKERQKNGTFTASLSGPVASGTLNLNGVIAYEKERYRQVLLPVSSDAASSALNGRYRTRKNELGADWTRALGNDWTTKLIGLSRGETSSFSEAWRSAGEREAFLQRKRTVELVGRATVTRQGDHRLLPEIGGELAWNKLDSRFSLGETPAEHRRVSELRADVFANLSFRLLSSVRLEAGLGFEVSRIAVDQDRLLSRTLRYWKPNATLAWNVGPNTQARIGMRHIVGQLDFEAFAASGDILNNRPISGNARLNPEITTAWSATLDHRFGQHGGALSVSVAREAIDDALAYVPLDQGGQALANFGTVRLWRVTGKATLPFDRYIRGAQLAVDGEWLSSRRPDAMTASYRTDARDNDKLELAWRHDLDRLRLDL